MIVLATTAVTKHFGPDPVLDEVSFEVRPKERIGLVGPNGAGKTTLLKILSGQETADAGQVVLHSSARLAYLEQQPQFPVGWTVWEAGQAALAPLVALAKEAEEVAHAISITTDSDERGRLEKRYDVLQQQVQDHDAYHLDHRVERILEGLGFAPHTHTQQVAHLSGGQQNRLLLATLLLSEPDVMLLDEPSNHLDIEATEWLENYLAASQQAMIVVSHDRYFLDRVTNRTLELFRGKIDQYTGNFSAYWRQKAERLEVERRTYERQQAEIAKTEDFIRRNHYGQKSTQAEDRRKKLARIERLEPPRKIAAPPMGFPSVRRTGDMVLRAENLSKNYARQLFAGLSLQVERGQRWGILGPNGCGKTTLLRCLVGEEKPDTGRVAVGTHVKIGYFDQLLRGLAENSLVVDAIRPSHKEFNEPQRRELLAKFGLTGDLVFQNVDKLSGGERNRTALARLAAEDANFLVLDEPTNHLDLWARDALERALTSFDGTVLFVSHDRYFLNRVADHLLIVEPDRFRIVEGNYDAYLQGTAPTVTASAGGSASAPSAPTSTSSLSASDSTAVTKPKPSAKPVESATKRKRKFPYRKVSDLEADIFDHETRLEELNEALLKPELHRDGDRVRQVKADISETQERLRTLYEHWEEASELN